MLSASALDILPNISPDLGCVRRSSTHEAWAAETVACQELQNGEATIPSGGLLLITSTYCELLAPIGPSCCILSSTLIESLEGLESSLIVCDTRQTANLDNRLTRSAQDYQQ
ncbi:protein of unknown function [Candidatus Promineifilum breve]|uniref:Uncharacterized protein n=1 Tax=Candidatus Promineifilum breve TaxID=1806508 RepID=A0A160T633_9CHLR|nr:protein of unknown function [Candidatus Promineifilum breve]